MRNRKSMSVVEGGRVLQLFVPCWPQAHSSQRWNKPHVLRDRYGQHIRKSKPQRKGLKWLIATAAQYDPIVRPGKPKRSSLLTITTYHHSTMADDAAQREYEEWRQIIDPAGSRRVRGPQPAQPAQHVPPRGEGAHHARHHARGTAAARTVQPRGSRGSTTLSGCLSPCCYFICVTVVAWVVVLVVLAVVLPSLLLLAPGGLHQPSQTTPTLAPMHTCPMHTETFRVPDRVTHFLDILAVSWNDVARIQSWADNPDSGLDDHLVQPVRELLDIFIKEDRHCYASNQVANVQGLGRSYSDLSDKLKAQVSAPTMDLDNYIMRLEDDIDRYWYLVIEKPCASTYCFGLFLAKHMNQWWNGDSNTKAAAEAVLSHARWLDEFVRDRNATFDASFSLFKNISDEMGKAATKICEVGWTMKSWQHRSENLNLWWAVEQQANKNGLSLEGVSTVSMMACEDGVRQAAKVDAFLENRLRRLAKVYKNTRKGAVSIMEKAGGRERGGAWTTALKELLNLEKTLRDRYN
jgi:hypothetical protein